MFRALKNHNFRLFATGQFISIIGTWSQMLAVSWLVWKMTGSEAWLGAINFINQIPFLFFGLLGGFAADRFNRLNSLVAMEILCLLQALLLGILTLTGVVQLWQVAALSAVLGIVYSFEFPIRHAFVADTVEKDDLLSAISLNVAMFHGGRIVGPALAGIIVAWKGEGACFTFNAATFIFLIVALLMIDRKCLPDFKINDESIFESIKDGLRYFKNSKQSRLAIYMVLNLSVFGMTFIALMPAFADKVLGGSSLELGWLMSAGGLGSLSGALWMAARKDPDGLGRTSINTSFLFSIAIIAFSLSKILFVAAAFLLVAGFFLTASFSGITTLLQKDSPVHLRGRVMSVFTTAFMGLSPFGSLLAGITAKKIGSPLTITSCGLICAVFSAWIYWVMRGRQTTENR